MYLSIIITSYFVGKLFNPIPFTQYGFYVIVTALFVPYFGKWGCLKILLTLSSISMIQDIPFYITMYQTWPTVYQGIFAGITGIVPNTIIEQQLPNFSSALIHPLFFDYIQPYVTMSNIHTLMAIQGSGITTISLLVGGFYLGIANALYVLSKAYKKVGVYNRINF